MDINVDEISLRDLKAEVVSHLPTAAGDWCHGLRFRLEDAQMEKNEVFRGLLLIEDKLRSLKNFG